MDGWASGCNDRQTYTLLAIDINNLQDTYMSQNCTFGSVEGNSSQFRTRLIETNGCNMWLPHVGDVCVFVESWRELVLHIRTLEYEYICFVCVFCTGVWFVYHCLIERKSRKRFPFLQVPFTSLTSHAQKSYCIQQFLNTHTHTGQEFEGILFIKVRAPQITKQTLCFDILCFLRN